MAQLRLKHTTGIKPKILIGFDTFCENWGRLNQPATMQIEKDAVGSRWDDNVQRLDAKLD